MPVDLIRFDLLTQDALRGVPDPGAKAVAAVFAGLAALTASEA